METTVHGELDEFGCGTSWKKPPLKRKRMYTIFQNGLGFLWEKPVYPSFLSSTVKPIISFVRNHQLWKKFILTFRSIHGNQGI